MKKQKQLVTRPLKITSTIKEIEMETILNKLEEIQSEKWYVTYSRQAGKCNSIVDEKGETIDISEKYQFVANGPFDSKDCAWHENWYERIADRYPNGAHCVKGSELKENILFKNDLYGVYAIIIFLEHNPLSFSM